MSAAQELPGSAELLRLLLEQCRDHAIILLDPQGRVVGWLAGAEHIFGYRADEMVGQPASRLFTPEDAERGLSEHELRVAAADGRAEDDRWQVRKDGTRIWASGAVVALRDGRGELVGFGKVLRDRTDLKGQLEAAERKAEALAQADERKSLFLGTLAHELRNPLAPLGNALQLIRLTVPDHANLAYATGMIERQVDFIKRLVDDLLDVTRIGAGKVQLQPQEVRLAELLRRVAEDARPAAQEHRQNLRLLVPATEIVVRGDPNRLHQVFVNLLTNALKYTPEGGRVWLKATVEEDEAVTRVEDTGVGIGPEMLPRLFELFAQEESSRGRSQDGLGLGLALVKNLVTLHGGTVQVRSEGKGKGSEFTVRLPLVRAQPAGQGAPGEREKSA